MLQWTERSQRDYRRMKETLQMQSVISHPAFQTNPMEALKEHLINSQQAEII